MGKTRLILKFQNPQNKLKLGTHRPLRLLIHNMTKKSTLALHIAKNSRIGKNLQIFQSRQNELKIDTPVLWTLLIQIMAAKFALAPRFAKFCEFQKICKFWIFFKMSWKLVHPYSGHCWFRLWQQNLPWRQDLRNFANFKKIQNELQFCTHILLTLLIQSAQILLP